MKNRLKLLIVEGNASLAAVYRAYLAKERYALHCVGTLAEGHAVLESWSPDLVLLDVELPDGDSIDFLRQCMARSSRPKVIVMSARGDASLASAAIKIGAADFLSKPFDPFRLTVTLANAAEQMALREQLKALAGRHRNGYEELIGASAPMQSVYETIDALAASDATGFIVGESGTGKALAAAAIHANSRRSAREFVAINGSAMSAERMESQLFGHARGVFTGGSAKREGAAHSADGGTLFLSEICAVDLDLQKKLLRFIQTGTFRRVGSNTLETVNLRFICASNRDPLIEVREGRLREDLFYHLHVVPLRLPPLRERKDDIMMLANHYLPIYARQADVSLCSFSNHAERLLLRYPWPGNVRQLLNVLQRAVVLYEGERVEAHMLPSEVRDGLLDAPASAAAATGPEAAAATGPEAAPAAGPEAAPAAGPEAASAAGRVGGSRVRRATEPLWMAE